MFPRELAWVGIHRQTAASCRIRWTIACGHGEATGAERAATEFNGDVERHPSREDKRDGRDDAPAAVPASIRCAVTGLVAVILQQEHPFAVVTFPQEIARPDGCDCLLAFVCRSAWDSGRIGRRRSADGHQGRERSFLIYVTPVRESSRGVGVRREAPQRTLHRGVSRKHRQLAASCWAQLDHTSCMRCSL